MNSLPDFVGIGAERAGTSWIYACLQEHPDLCMPEKELNFFSRERHWKKGVDWYRGNFSICDPDQRTGEYSTSYLASPEAPKRIHEIAPDVRLIVSLRNPIERAYSSYRNDRASGDLDQGTSFAQALDKNQKYRDASRYATHLRRYREYFEPEDILVLRYESIRKDPHRFLESIYRFLDVDDSFEPTMINERINPAHEARIPGLSKYMNLLSKTLRSNGWTRSVWWAAKRMGLGALIRSANSRETGSREPDSAARAMLRESLQPEVRELRSMLGWKNEVWSEDFPGKPNEEDPRA